MKGWLALNAFLLAIIATGALAFWAVGLIVRALQLTGGAAWAGWLLAGALAVAAAALVATRLHRAIAARL